MASAPGRPKADANERGRPTLSHALVALMRGVVYREDDPSLWQALVNLQARVRDQVAVLGLELVLDEAEGYGYLRQRPPAEGEPELPRLVARRQLGFQVSLLLVLLRKKLAEADAGSGELRLILSREQIVELVRLFAAEATNEARLVNRIHADLEKVVELGFLRKLKGSEDQFEVQRILKAFVDAQWLQDFEQRLAGYRKHLESQGDGEAP